MTSFLEAVDDWNHTFDELVAAKSLQHGQSFLKQYLAGCPHDEVALRPEAWFILSMEYDRVCLFVFHCVGHRPGKKKIISQKDQDFISAVIG